MSAHVEPLPKLLLLLYPPAHPSGEICWSPKQTRLAPLVPIVLSMHTIVVWTRVCAFLHVPSMRPLLSHVCITSKCYRILHRQPLTRSIFIRRLKCQAGIQ